MKSHCDLKQHFKHLSESIPVDEDENFTFSHDTLPKPPTDIATSELVVNRTYNYYQGYCHTRCDALHFYATKETYRYLGLLILSAVFQPNGETSRLQLLNSSSSIKALLIKFEVESLEDPPIGYSTRPYVFNYYSKSVAKHPWYPYNKSPWNLPAFNLTHENDHVGITNEEWDSRDTVIGFGSDVGSVKFAELLLNLSQPEGKQDEFGLEGEIGFRGVAPGSAEAYLWLPGSFGWNNEYWNED